MSGPRPSDGGGVQERRIRSPMTWASSTVGGSGGVRPSPAKASGRSAAMARLCR